MLEFKPILPISLLVLYWCLSFVILILCALSLVAVYRTKKTPYGTKLLSLGLLTYDILFLLAASASKPFDYTDVYPIVHASRGFTIAAQFIVGCMSFERLFVLNWPYVYLRAMSEQRTKIICIAICILGFLHYSVMRGAFCYARGQAMNCELGFAAYLVFFCTVIPAVSFICFVKIYKIIRRSEAKHRTKHAIRQYKGTVAAFLVLVNTTVSQIVWLGLAVIYFTRTARGQKEDGYVATLADWSYLLNCIVDPTIYVIWFSETRMEMLKLLKCPCVKPKIEKLRKEIYHISFTDEKSITKSTDSN